MYRNASLTRGKTRLVNTLMATGIVGALMTAVLAVGLMPLPAFAQAEEGLAAGALVSDAPNVQADAQVATQADDVDAYWYNFRNSENNMAIVDVKTPIDPDTTKLIWANKLGTGYAMAPSPQLIIDNALVVTAGTNIYKLDLKTGKILAQGEMTAATNWAYTPMTYAEGMVFVPISSGIQAFDAKTLESLWVYKDMPSTQALSQIVYSDGYLYTGYWIAEADSLNSDGTIKLDCTANYVCVSVTDEDPTQATESKNATWTFQHKGGFYWAGGVAIGNYIIVGSEDGTSGNGGDSVLRAFDKATGQVASSITLTGMGDQRSSMAWDATRNRVFFTTKGGFIASAAFDAATGQLSDLKYVETGAQCTGTPIIYDDVLYVGAGSGFGNNGSFVACNADTLEILYTKPLKGYPQASMLLSTAYKDRGFLFFYSTYNTTPGGLQMIRVPVGATTGSNVKVTDLYDANGYSQYCICSPIAGPDGTIYYKNDSGTVLAIRPNTAPDLADGLNAYAEATVMKGVAYTLDLSPLFTDEDGDPLTYMVSINGATAVPADAAYSFTPDATGIVKLVFTAKDGAESSFSSYTVNLTVTVNEAAEKEAADKEAASAVSALIAKLPAASKATALDRAAANNAKKAYDALTDDQKAYVSAADVNKMNAVKKAADNEYNNGLATGKTFKVTAAQGAFTYKVTAKKQVTLTKAASTKKGGSITVDTVKFHDVTYKVTAIGAKAFKSSKLGKITLGANVTTIGAQAFANSANLAAFTVGKNVKKIGASAFSKTAKLKKLTVKSPKLNAKSTVSNALKGSSVKTVTLSGLTKAQKKKVAKAFASAGKKGVIVK